MRGLFVAWRWRAGLVSRRTSVRVVAGDVRKGGVACVVFLFSLWCLRAPNNYLNIMTKSELIEVLSIKQTHLMQKDVELAVKLVLDQVSMALEKQQRVEIRGFGSFALHHRPARVGRNPKSGESVQIPAKHVPHFKPGKEMRERVNALVSSGSATTAINGGPA